MKNQQAAEENPIYNKVHDLARLTKQSAQSLLCLSDASVDNVLRDIAGSIRSHKNDILNANAVDVAAASDKGLSDAQIDRLRLNDERIESIASSCEAIASLPHPAGRILWEDTRPNGLKIQRVSVPIGVLGMIYESRPNVTVDAAALCLKSRNAVLLRGGSESLNSSLAFHSLIQKTLQSHGIAPECVSMIPMREREAVGAMLSMDDMIDVIIPRGGKSLIERVMHDAKMPVFGHLEGICHVYVDQSAAPEIALDVVLNAKMRRTGICGAAETLLIDRNYNSSHAANIICALLDEGCEVRGDEDIQALDERVISANDNDWVCEYLAPVISCRMVDGVDDAIAHINKFGTHHTDSIIAQDDDAVRRFQTNVDSGIVMHNTSTQFADGGEFGLGAEIGIATGKLHARGPVGLEQLCSYKYLVHGNGQIRPR